MCVVNINKIKSFELVDQFPIHTSLTAMDYITHKPTSLIKFFFSYLKNPFFNKSY